MVQPFGSWGIGAIYVFAALASLWLLGISSCRPAAADDALPPSLHLLMIEEEGCGYCARWHREVGPGYPKSDEGRQAPLLTVDRRSAAAGQFERIVYTPTFLLVRDGRELGRIVGYAGSDFFWWQLADLLRKSAP